MTSVLTTVNERSTLSFEVAVTDLNGDPVTPTSFTWSLTDRDGTVINSREDVVATPGTTVTVNITGADLQIVDSTADQEYRLFTVKTDMGASGLPVNHEVAFWVKNLTKVS